MRPSVPPFFNSLDRLLLGMKGTMSEAELHILRARLRGGILNQAQRAALKLQLPVGLVYVEDETIHLDPDAQVQHALRVLFATFKRTGSAWATVKYFRDQHLLFPHRIRTGPHAGTIHWSALTHNGVLKILRNPRYAGAFCYGRTHTSKGLDGSLHVETVPQEAWPFSSRTSMWATSLGRSLKRIVSNCSRTVRSLVATENMAQHEKGRPFCKGWSFAGNAEIA